MATSRMSEALDREAVRSGEMAFWTALEAATRPPEDIVAWCGRVIDMSFDLTSHASGPMVPYPYQAEPLRASLDDRVLDITLMMGQRLGKSQTWKAMLLRRLYDGGCSALVVYPTADMAEKTNHDTLLPLIQSLPEFRRDLAVVGNRRKDGYYLPSSRSVVYFLGGGAQVINYTASWCVADETDFVDPGLTGEEGKNVDNVSALRLRTKTFPLHKVIACSSPTSYGGTIYGEWRDGSRGTWCLRCQKCGALSPASRLSWPKEDGRFAGLQWEKTEAGDIREDTLRWVCPQCGHEHGEDEARKMSLEGAYVHELPDRLEHRSYQCGALGNPWLWRWREIAAYQEAAVDANGKKKLRNIVLGLPYKHVREGDVSISIPDVLKGKSAGGEGVEASVACAGIDQQASALAGAKYYVYAVRGWAEDGSSLLLDHGILNSAEEIAALCARKWQGLPLSIALLDQGGFGDNASRTDGVVMATPCLWYYKGGADTTTGLKGEPWMKSPSQRKLILANAGAAQVELLDALYGSPHAEGYRWTLPADIDADYLAQLGAVQPARTRNGDAFPNWTAGSARHDYFDAEKMAQLALRVACRWLPASRFRHGQLPLFVRAEALRAAVRARAALELKKSPAAASAKPAAGV